MNKLRVLFVCMGNICRSPTAHGVFRKRVLDEGLENLIEIDSAGTHAYHVGDAPDPRSSRVALENGIDLSGLRARQVSPGDFSRYRFILAMDRDNFRHLYDLAPDEEARERIALFMDFARNYPGQRDLPDPYYGGENGFQLVFDMVSDASEGLLARVKQEVYRF